jgi:hypothetical protein
MFRIDGIYDFRMRKNNPLSHVCSELWWWVFSRLMLHSSIRKSPTRLDSGVSQRRAIPEITFVFFICLGSFPC